MYYVYAEKNVKMFLDLLLELSNADANFSDNDLKDEVITMMLAVSSFDDEIFQFILKFFELPI